MRASILSLISTPDKFDGKRVQVFGYYVGDFRGSGLYFHEEDRRQNLTVNAIAVSQWFPHLADGYVLMEGRFSAEPGGPWGLWGGDLLDVTRAIAWPPRPEPS